MILNYTFHMVGCSGNTLVRNICRPWEDDPMHAYMFPGFLGTNFSPNLGIHQIWGLIWLQIWGQILRFPIFGEEFSPKYVLKGAGSFHIHRKTMKDLCALAVLGVREQPNLAYNLATHSH